MEPKERQLGVLRAVVSQYVQTGEPVSSKAVANASQLDVSSATIRSDMAVLEEAGLISQPHTSAGRIPTESGYRRFVDRLTELQPLSLIQRRAIEQFLAEPVDATDVITRTVRLLARLTGAAAVAEYPTLGNAVIRHIDLVDLDLGRIVLVVVTSQGRVSEAMMNLDAGAEAVERIKGALRENLVGIDCRTAISKVPSLTKELKKELGDSVSQIELALEETLGAQSGSRLVAAGLSNLARSGTDFVDVSAVLDTIEEQVVLLRLLTELHTDPLEVSIGAENRDHSLEGAAVVSGSYSAGARIGIVGPTRMDYPGSLAAVEAVSRYLSQLMERN
jgi:heat shock gene repressor HrcA